MKQICVCMICGAQRHVLREGSAALCTRCLEALAEALGDKLPSGTRDLPGNPAPPSSPFGLPRNPSPARPPLTESQNAV